MREARFAIICLHVVSRQSPVAEKRKKVYRVSDGMILIIDQSSIQSINQSINQSTSIHVQHIDVSFAMIFKILSLLLAVSTFGSALQVLPGSSKTLTSIKSSRDVSCHAARRELLSSMAGGFCSLVLLPTPSAFSDDEGDLASQLFNPDGTLKEGVEAEAKQRFTEFKWDFSDNLSLREDGVDVGDTKPGSQVRLSYTFPFKWSDGKDGDPLYFDRSEGTNAKACKRITVYQAPGKADAKLLQKAATIGVAKSLIAPDGLKRLYKADIISGRISTRNDQTYYEFDMAAAPETCGESKENLGLGFCPYDNIFLLSATIVADRLFVIVVECDSTRIWKLASSDLKRVRSSFVVEEL